MLRLVKNRISRILLATLDRVLALYQGRDILRRHTPYLGDAIGRLPGDRESGLPDPYRQVRAARSRQETSNFENVIFVSGWFRTGSTLVWNLFRDLPGVTSYYEPFNERRWFRRDMRGERVDNTHMGVNDYWQEYEGLTHLDRYFRDDWYYKNLYMDAHSWAPAMRAYIDELIRSGEPCAVLQFNRLCFRLAWVRQNFPGARILHLYRDPRDQWLSFIKSKARCAPDASFATLGTQDFFYLRKWGRDLVNVYPLLDEDALSHPYELFYLIWRLSFTQGERYATHSISIESICEDPQASISGLFRDLSIDTAHLPSAVGKVAGPVASKWQDYAADDWFSTTESHCESLLDDYYRSRH